jgi:hypothetical protein
MINKILTVVVAVFIGVAAMYVYGKTISNETKSHVTINSIKKIAELAAIEYNMSVIREVTKKKKFLQLKKAKFLVLLTGKIKGSVDLNKSKIDIDKENKIVNINFNKGAVGISNPEIGPDDIRIITVSNPKLINKVNDEDRNKAQKDAITILREEAIDKGIVKQTKNEAKIVISGFLSALGYKSTIKFN